MRGARPTLILVAAAALLVALAAGLFLDRPSGESASVQVPISQALPMGSAIALEPVRIFINKPAPAPPPPPPPAPTPKVTVRKRVQRAPPARPLSKPEPVATIILPSREALEELRRERDDARRRANWLEAEAIDIARKERHRLNTGLIQGRLARALLFAAREVAPYGPLCLEENVERWGAHWETWCEINLYREFELRIRARQLVDRPHRVHRIKIDAALDTYDRAKPELLRLADELPPLPAHPDDAPLDKGEAWRRLLELVNDQDRQRRLTGLLRFTQPAEVLDLVLRQDLAYERYVGRGNLEAERWWAAKQIADGTDLPAGHTTDDYRRYKRGL